MKDNFEMDIRFYLSGYLQGIIEESNEGVISLPEFIERLEKAVAIGKKELSKIKE